MASVTERVPWQACVSHYRSLNFVVNVLQEQAKSKNIEKRIAWLPLTRQVNVIAGRAHSRELQFGEASL